MSTRTVKGTKKQTVDPYDQQTQKCIEMSNRRKALLKDKKYWQLRLLMLKEILKCLMHNDMSCPNGKGKHFEHCQTCMVVKSHLPGNGRTHTEPSPALQITNSRVYHTFQKTQTTLSERASATRMNCVQDRETSDSHVSPAGHKMSQEETFCAVRETCRQQSESDTSQTFQLFPSSANSSSDNGRRDFAMPTANVNVPDPINQAMPVPSGSVVEPDCFPQINHTEKDVFNYLQVMPVPAGSVVESDCFSQINHTEKDVFNYLQAMPVPAGSVVESDCFSQINHTEKDVFNYLQAMPVPAESVVESDCFPQINHAEKDVFKYLQAMPVPAGSVVESDCFPQINHTEKDVFNYLQAMPVPAESVVEPDCFSQINHTENDVFNYLQGIPVNRSVLQPSCFVDVLDIISKDSQSSFNTSSLNSSQQDQNNPDSSHAVCHGDSSSLLSEIGHSRILNRNRKNIRVIKHQACIKPCASKSKAKMNVNAEDDDVDKGRAKTQVKVADNVTVVRELIECLTIDNKKQ